MDKIDQVLELDRNYEGYNIFLEDYRIFKNLESYLGQKDVSSLDIYSLVEKTRDFIIGELINFNQYIYIDCQLKNSLDRYFETSYRQLGDKLGDLKVMEKGLKDLLLSYDEIRILDSKSLKFTPIPCSQYSPKYQLRILGIDEKDLQGNIIDIGCGRDHGLVKHLRSLGHRAVGLDRYDFKEDYLYRASWLDFDFAAKSYSAVIAHMSFSNHFKREHMKLGQLVKDYREKYFEILASLEVGGSFYYSPSLDFMEDKLDRDRYYLEYRTLSTGMKSVRIKKLV